MSVIIKIKQIHEYTSDHLRSCFPLLPSYEAFNMRINRLSEAFRNLSDMLLSGYCPQDCDLSTSLMDSLPINNLLRETHTIGSKRENRYSKSV